VFLAVGVFVLYHEALWFKFVSYDDDRYVTDNPVVALGLTWEGVKYAFTTGDATNWLPLTWLSHMALVEMFEFNAMPHHLLNIVVHALNAVLLFVVLRRFTGQVWPSAAVAAIFALHPLTVESVVWVSERKGLFNGLFWLLGFLAYGRYVRGGKARYYALTALCFALALLSKPTSITFPCVLLLLDYWPLGRYAEGGSFLRRAGWLALEKVPLFLLCVPSAVITYITQNTDTGQVDTWEPIPLAYRVPNAIVSYAAYPWKMIWPADLAVHYPHRMGSTPMWIVVAIAVGLIAVTALAIALRRSRPYFVVGWLWYVGTLAPVIGFVQIGTHGMADRYIYLPMIGLLIVMAWGLRDLAGRFAGSWRVLAPCAGVVLVALFAVSFVQARVWRSSATLYRHALDVTADNGKMHYAMAGVKAGSMDFRGGLEHLEEAARLMPKNAAVLGMTASYAHLTGDMESAVLYYARALALDPTDRGAHETLRRIAKLDRGETAEAARGLLESVGVSVEAEGL
jgi:tetratricopeptide (TPR) repeat protein